MPENRDNTAYFGAILNNVEDPDTGLIADNFFIAQGAFALRPNSLTYFYSTWASAQKFDSWKKSLQEFKKIYLKTGSDFNDFQTGSSEFAGQQLNHAQIVGGIIETCRALCSAPQDADFVYCSISPETFNSYMEFEKNGQKYIFAQTDATYNQTIQANLQIVGAAALMGHALAISTDPDFWANAAWILPE